MGIIYHMLAIHKNCVLSLLTVLILLGTVSAVNAEAEHPASKAGIVDDNGDGQLQPMADRFTIQVAAYKTLPEVEKGFKHLIDKGCNPFCRREAVDGKGEWYRVYVGTYATKDEARKAATYLVKRDVVDAYMLRKLNENGAYLFTADLKTEEKRAPIQISQSGQISTVSQVQQGEAPAIASMKQSQTAGSSLELFKGSVTKMTPVRLSLTDAIRYSLEGNREIGVVAYEPQLAQEVVKDAQSVYDPLLFSDMTLRRDPNLESSVNDIVTEDRGTTRTGVRKPLGTGGNLSAYLETRYGDLNNAEFDRVYKHVFAPTLEVRQPLLNNLGAKKEKTAIKVANYQESISNEEFRQKVIEVAINVAQVYWKLYQFRELIAVNQQNLDMAEEVYRREAERLDRGITQQLDVERARSNVQVRRSTLLRSKEEFQVAMDRLKLLLNWNQLRIDSDYEVIPIEAPQTEPLNLDEMEAIQTALKYRPEIMKAKQEFKISEADEALAAHLRLPKLDAFGRYGLTGYGQAFGDAVDDTSFNQDDIWEVGVNFTWAIGNRSVNAQYRKKKLERLQANAQVERLEDDIKLDVKQVFQRILATIGEIEASRLAREAAGKVVEGEFARFDIGQTSNLELLRAQDLFALTSRSFYRAITDYNIALHELSRAQGILPEGVTIEEARR
jgi:outer membrane protein TolC